MECPRCQFQNRDGVRFCEECGAKLEQACPACGAVLPLDRKFCGDCGQTLAGAPAAAPPTPAPGAYTPAHLAERILNSRSAVEGERKQVTVLFADLKGSMELLADRDPEKGRHVLDAVLARMMEAVHRYEGFVNQVQGDGIMALFGAPLAHEDHALRACYAALHMQTSVQQYAAQVRQATGAPVQIRVGLNSGEVVVRSIASDLKTDYSAVGRPTHLAARMEQLAAPGSIVLTAATLQLVEGQVQVRALGPLPVRGLAEPVEAYELVGAAAGRTRFQAAALRGLTRFVGRETELATLRRTLEQAAAGRGQLVAVVGEPGVGKSRLVWEFAHSHRAAGWLVLETRSVSYGQATSYLPVIDLLKSWCGIEARDTPRRMRERLTGKLLTLDPALQPTLPALLALLDLPVDDPAWQHLDPPQRRQRTLDALKRLLLRECQEQPVLLVMEDLHWLDSETQALLDSLVESLPGARLLLLVNYRPEYTHTWGSRTYYQQLRLDPLPAASADALLDALLGEDAALAPLKALLIARTEGNPFFLEESVRALVETGALAGERGAYQLTQPVESTRVPATVQAVLAARIDRLAPEDKRLLQAAAVIGRDVPLPLLQAIAELPEPALQQGLARLQTEEFLYQTALFPEQEYTFKHALTHEVAHGSLLQERRLALHARIVEAIESLYVDRLAEHVERLAHHALGGEAWEKAVSYLRQAGARAAVRSAYREATTFSEQALRALAHLPESPATWEQAIDLHTELFLLLLNLGELRRLVGYLREAETLAKKGNDRRRLGWIEARLMTYLWNTGDYSNTLQSGARALAIAADFGDVPLQAQTDLQQGYACYWLGDYSRAISAFTRSVAALPGDLRYLSLPHVPAVLARGGLAGAFTERGEFAEAIAAGEEAIQIAEAVGNPFSLVSAYSWCGVAWLGQGSLERATGALDHAVTICRQRHIPLVFSVAASRLGYTYLLAGRIPDAVALLEEAADQQESIGKIGALALTSAWLSEAYLGAGRREESAPLARRALELSRQFRERGNEAWTLRLLGEIAAQADPPNVEQADVYYRQALALAEEPGMRPLVAHCHLGLGTLWQKVGRREQALAELNVAAEMYRGMEMTFWLAKAEAALAQEQA